MNIAPSRGGTVIALTFLLALVLTIMPLPDWSQEFRPQWTALVLLYWAMATPTRVGVGIGWLVGILVDILTGTLLGQHAFAHAIIAFIMLKIYQRTRVLPLRQQAATILVILLVERLLTLWTLGATGYPPPSLWYWAAPLVGALLWPWLYVMLRDLRRRFRVS